MNVWYSLWSFGIFFPFWYAWRKTNLVTLMQFASSSYLHWVGFQKTVRNSAMAQVQYNQIFKNDPLGLSQPKKYIFHSMKHTHKL
jgi:hypothetical protein